MWGFDIHHDPEHGYGWRLWLDDGRRAAASPSRYPSRSNAERALARFADVAGTNQLQVATCEDATGAITWQALGPDGELLAASVRTYPDATTAVKAARRVRLAAPIAPVD